MHYVKCRCILKFMHYSFTPSDGRSVWVGGEKTQAHSNLLYLAFRPGFYFTRVMVIPRNFRICFQNWKQTQKMPMNWYDSDTQDQNEICQIVVHNIRVKTLLTLYIVHICMFVTCVWNPIFFKNWILIVWYGKSLITPIYAIPPFQTNIKQNMF